VKEKPGGKERGGRCRIGGSDGGDGGDAEAEADDTAAIL
jgi:hypothetical protein